MLKTFIMDLCFLWAGSGHNLWGASPWWSYLDIFVCFRLCTFALSQSSKPALFLYLRKCKVGLPLTSFKLFQEELDTLFHLPQVLELLSTLRRTQWETFSLMPCTWMQSPFLHLAHQVIFQILLQGKVNRTACILVHVGMEVLFTISWTLPA